jgi:hypothetical protein
MARNLTFHTLACLTRQGAEELATRMMAGDKVRAVRAVVNRVEGKMLVEVEAPDRLEVEKWLKAEELHYEWILRAELEFGPEG